MRAFVIVFLALICGTTVTVAAEPDLVVFSNAKPPGYPRTVYVRGGYACQKIVDDYIEGPILESWTLNRWKMDSDCP